MQIEECGDQQLLVHLCKEGNDATQAPVRRTRWTADRLVRSYGEGSKPF